MIRTAPNLYPQAQTVLGGTWQPSWSSSQIAIDFGVDIDEQDIWLAEEPLASASKSIDQLLPDPDVWAKTLTLGLAECFSGVRSPQQLINWLDFHIYRAVVTQCPKALNMRGTRPKIISVKTLQATNETAEVCSVVRLGNRSRAFAMQLRVKELKWRCCSLIVG